MKDNQNMMVDSVPQLRVKSGLRGGQSIESCSKNVDYWQKEYQKWYQQAVSKGYLPPVAVPYNT